MSRRIKTIRAAENRKRLVEPELDLNSFFSLVPLESDWEMAPAIPGVVDNASLRIADVYSPTGWRPRYRSLLSSLRTRKLVVEPWLAPRASVQKSSLTLAEKDRLFKSRRNKDVLGLFYSCREDLPRPDESNQEVRNLCVAWKRKYEGGSPRALPRFCKRCPELAAWACWVERAIHETQIRSTKNKSPRLDLLRQCVAILATAQVERLARQHH
jgi:hypothetical protein